MFQPNRPSSGVQVVVMKESATQCNAVLFFLCSCLELILGYVGYHAVTMHVFPFYVILEVYFKVHIYVYSVSAYLMLVC
jgi:hypothetical protein